MIAKMIKKILYLVFPLFYDKKYLNSKKLRADWILRGIFFQKILQINPKVPFPVSSPTTRVAIPKNIDFHIDGLNNFQMNGSYFQAYYPIKIGKGTLISNNVGIITANHDFYDLSKNGKFGPVTIGKNCWIGMNAMILPKVELGDNTIVGAGSVVTKSFPEGNLIIAGNPAKILKKVLV